MPSLFDWLFNNKDEEKTYIVQPNDNLSILAERFKVPLKDLLASNSISNPNKIRVGQKLVIPKVTKNTPAPSERKSTFKILPPVEVEPITSEVYNPYAERIKKDPKRFNSEVNWDNANKIYNIVYEKLGPESAAAILANILPESLADPFKRQLISKKGRLVPEGKGFGLLQWELGTERYKNLMNYNKGKNALEKQTNYIIDSTLEKLYRDDWHYGGKRSPYPYKRAEEMRKAFLDDNTSMEDKAAIFGFGYVRPKSTDEIYRRKELVNSVDSIFNPKFFKPVVK